MRVFKLTELIAPEKNSGSAFISQFIAETEAEFASIGAYWAENRHELNTVRLGLRERMKASPLTDAATYTQDFEANVEKVWSEFLEGHR